jgi:hypothetical protein
MENKKTEFEQYELTLRIESAIQDVFDWFEDHPEVCAPDKPYQAALNYIKYTVKKMSKEQ